MDNNVLLVSTLEAIKRLEGKVDTSSYEFEQLWLVRNVERVHPCHRVLIQPLIEHGEVGAAQDIVDKMDWSLFPKHTREFYDIHLLFASGNMNAAALCMEKSSGEWRWAGAKTHARMVVNLPPFVPEVLRQCAAELNKWAHGPRDIGWDCAETQLMYIGEDVQLFRYTDENSQDSIYFTDVRYATVMKARKKLAIEPFWNKMNTLSSWVIHAPALAFHGYAMRQGPWRGGGRQILMPLAANKTHIFTVPFATDK